MANQEISSSLRSILREGTAAALISSLLACGGSGSGGFAADSGAALKAEADIVEPGSEAIAKIDAAGGSVAVSKLGSLSFGAGFFRNSAQIRLRRVDSAKLDADRENGSDLFNVLDYAKYHIDISGVPTYATAVASFPVVLRVPPAIAKQSSAAKVPGVLVWTLDATVPCCSANSPYEPESSHSASKEDAASVFGLLSPFQVSASLALIGCS